MRGRSSSVAQRKSATKSVCAHCGQTKPIKDMEPLTSQGGQFYDLPSKCCRSCWREIERQRQDEWLPELRRKWAEEAALARRMRTLREQE